MRKTIIGCVVVLSLGALVSSGCAKKDMVKTEEPVSASTGQTAPAKATPAQPEEVKSEPVAASKSEAEPSSRGAEQIGETKEVGQLQKIYFNFDSVALSEESRGILSKNAEFLSKQPSLKVRIEGNCDERGSDEYNMALGERRAKAAKDYLVNLGVQAERLSVISYGEEKPAVDGHDEAAWAKNRRDEFVIAK